MKEALLGLLSPEVCQPLELRPHWLLQLSWSVVLCMVATCRGLLVSQRANLLLAR